MHYSIEDRSRIVNSVRSMIKNFDNMSESSCLNSITKTVTDNQIQNLIYLLALENQGDNNTISKIILSECNRAESRAAGSAIITMSILSYLFSKNLDLKSRKDRLESIKKSRIEIINAGNLLSRSCKKPDKNDIINTLNNLNFSKSLERKIIDLILDSKIGDRVEVKKGSTSETTVFERIGNFLPIETPQIFLRNRNVWEFDNVNVLLIDGTIEEVSQIHHLLEVAASDKNPYLVICRRAAREVRDTIDLNFKRGTLNLILVETDFDVTYHHLFKDISVIFDCEFVNVQMGDTLSARLDKFLFKVDKIKIDRTGINFYHSLDKSESIRRYLFDIRESVSDISNLTEESIDAINRSIQFRSKFLNSRTKIILVGKEDLSENNVEISKIDTFMRSIPNIGSLGIIDNNDVNPGNEIIDKIFSIKNTGVLTQGQVFQALVSSFKIYEMICKAEKLFTIKY